MARNQNTDRDGNFWSESTKKAVWSKERLITDYPPDTWRYDKYGKVMKYSEHGNRDSKNGWGIDHINPVSNGGSDNMDNLQPLNWTNNADKADQLNWSCPM